MYNVTRNKNGKSFIRNVITVASGTAMAQVITILFSTIITRTYEPEIYGVFGVYTSLVTVFLPVVALTYPTAIVLPKSNREAKTIVKLSIILTILVSFVTFLIILFFRKPLVNLLNVQVLAPYLLLIPIMMFFEGFLQIMNQWLIRTQQFHVKARIAVLQSLALNSSYVGFGQFYQFSSTLIIISTLGKGLYALLLSLGAGIKVNTKLLLSSFKLKDTLKEVKRLGKEYSDFPKYRSPQVFIHGLSQGLPILVLTTFFGPATAAFYAIGIKVLEAPTQLIGNAIGDVFYPRIAEANNEGENITKLLFKSNIILALLGILPFSIIIFTGPWIFSLVFGSDWSTAGVYASWLALWNYFILISRPTIKALQVIGEQRFHLMFTVATIAIRLLGLLVGAFIFKDDVLTIILYSAIGSLLYIYLIIITLMKSKKVSYR